VSNKKVAALAARNMLREASDRPRGTLRFRTRAAFFKSETARTMAAVFEPFNVVPQPEAMLISFRASFTAK
jgi:hypothetical protein